MLALLVVILASAHRLLTAELDKLRIDLMHWEEASNRIRPHQALGYLTPLEFIERWQEKHGKEVMCH